jgi:hypothetical protein
MDQSPNASRKSNALGRVGGWSNEIFVRARAAVTRHPARAGQPHAGVLANPRERTVIERLRRWWG